MKTLTAYSKGFTEFVLENENHEHLGKLKYEKWFSFDAHITTAKSDSTIKMEGFWNSRMVQYNQNNQELLYVKQNWTGFAFKRNNEILFFLEWRGFLGSKMVLLDQNKSEVLTVETRFDWKKFNSDYQIQYEEHQNFDPDFLLLIIHCVNYQVMITAGT